ncbi:type 1 glutamine amidotransferase [Angustibacter luteus]|uniref:Type 1 glutamine amidotransferase n=1 Tax=Angustibacter luteus TaxID=658456 RepID=A0ABW1JDS9_9ACTN
MKVLFIKHDHLSPEGEVGARFAERGYTVVDHLVVPPEHFDTPDVEPHFPDPADFDVIVPLGAPWAAYDDALVGRWVQPELELLRSAHEIGVPVLGICFGGQLLALAHGGTVARAPGPEIGWHDVQSDDEQVVPSGPWFQWHFDRWRLPAQATEVARNPAASQAFVLGRNLAVQFHPELDSRTLGGWLGNGGERQLVEHGIDAEALLHTTRGHDERSRRRAHQVVDGFLDQVATR